MLRRYVEEGGVLIVTGWSGLFGERGDALQRSVLESLIGARLIGRLDSRDNHVRFGSRTMDSADLATLRAGLEPDWPLLVEGPAAAYEPTTATPIGELLRPHRTVRQRQGKEGTEWPMSAEAKVGPAVLLHTLGKGRVVTFAGSPDVATAGEHRIVEARKLLSNAVRALHPHPRLRIEAPAFVEVVAADDPSSRQFHVHFIAYAHTSKKPPVHPAGPDRGPAHVPGANPIEGSSPECEGMEQGCPDRSERGDRRATGE